MEAAGVKGDASQADNKRNPGSACHGLGNVGKQGGGRRGERHVTSESLHPTSPHQSVTRTEP